MKSVVVLYSGQIEVRELPAPVLQPGEVLVETAWSLISAGTETAALSRSEKAPSLLEQVIQKPDRLIKGVRKVLFEGRQSLEAQLETANHTARQTGYSLAGVVREVGPGVTDLKPGDRVACAGSDLAVHAEWVAVPRLLTCLVPDSVELDVAAMTTVASIALQGVRQAAPQLGEVVLVSGLGLIGMITAKLLAANGCTVIGVDPDERKREFLAKLGHSHVFDPDDPALTACAASLTGFHGVDATLICAATKNSGPVVQAMELTRKKGRVVVVGAVPMEIPRAPFYQKEIEFTIACSYGPGRYDPAYEKEGRDYPLSFVRWTENRNLQAVLELEAQGKLGLGDLITHRHPLSEARTAFRTLMGGTELAVGALLSYPGNPSPARAVRLESTPRAIKARGVAVVGTGGFAKLTYLKYLSQSSELAFVAACNRTPLSATRIQEATKVAWSGTDVDQMLGQPDVDAVIVCSQHDSHAEIAARALRAGKHVLVEKPAALTLEDCALLESLAQESGLSCSVGHNRRYSPHVRQIQRQLRALGAPFLATYRVNAGAIPAGHWTQDRNRGGGRLRGELCHFLDTLCFLAGAPPQRMSIEQLPAGGPLSTTDNWIVNLAFPDGSLGAIQYLSIGAKSLPKERLEVHQGGASFVLDDFLSLSIHKGESSEVHKLAEQDKGQVAQFREWEALLGGRRSDLMLGAEALWGTRLSILLDQAVQAGQATVEPAL
ncbi:MAG: Gfo/Idh/MocA family oxidoreductase [Candidatus Delongbacteria bacterium]